ncbi:MAG: EAL domain-containing protein [Actinomycetota bacterium]|nr:EAL domain-containing protein [Actinomycetota bacterium]
MAGARVTDRAWAQVYARRRLHARAELVLWAGYGLMGVFLLGYLASMIVSGEDQSWPLFSSWTVAGFEILGSLLCVARGLTRRSGRAVAVTLGLGLLMWAVGDLVLAIESRGGAQPATPSLVDVFYLGFFPLTYVAFVLFMRGEVRRLATPSWLDGAVAGLGAAAICAAFAFHSVLHVAGGGAIGAATNLAYPVADLLLLSLVVGGSTLMSGRRKAPWILLVAGIAINVAGDTANLFNTSLGRPGFVLDAIAWPASILLMSMSVWLRPRPANPLIVQKPATFVIPGLSAAGALVILFVGNLHATSRVAIALATATLVLVGIRLIRSVRAMRALSQERRHQSVTDELTGLGNRRFLSTVLDAFFADYDATAPRPRSLAFLFVDLDRFKEINDTYGHPAGDQVLKQLGPRLSGCLREADLLIRLGGDEFVVLLVDTDAEHAVAVAERLTDVLSQPFILGSMRASVGASIGIALAPTDAIDAASLLWCADIAMYRAKLGGAPYACFQPDLDKIGNRLELLDELRTAIDEHQLVLHYQPQLDLRTGQIVAVEGLVRWAHPRLGVVPPLDFLPFAEEAGLMGSITTLVLTDAIAQCAAWRSQGNLLTVSVNISGTNLLDPRFVGLVQDLLDSHGVPPASLVLELTETSVISDFARSQQVIQELSDVGVVVSIDDFGAGFTSLAHLSSLAVKELKLDRTFVSALASGANARDLDLVRSTIQLGHALGLRIVAEGIEDEATLELLSSLGCDLGQGYLICKPKPASHLALTAKAADPEPLTLAG